MFLIIELVPIVSWECFLPLNLYKSCLSVCADVTCLLLCSSAAGVDVSATGQGPYKSSGLHRGGSWPGQVQSFLQEHQLEEIGSRHVWSPLCARCKFALSHTFLNWLDNSWCPDRQLLFVDCLTSQQHVSVSQGRICSDNFTCCHTEIEVLDQTFHLTQSQYTDTRPTSPSTDLVTPGAWQGSNWSANF